MLNYNTNLKNDRLQKVIDHVDAGSGNGVLVIGTGGMSVVLATVTLAKPSFTAPSSGQIAMADLPRRDLSANANGTPAAATITDSDGTVVCSGLTVGVGGSGADIILSAATLAIDDEFRLEAGVIVHA